MSADTTDSIKVRFRKSGDLTIVEDGSPIVIAHYDRKSGHLEWVTKDFAARYAAQATIKIGSTGDGTTPSPNMIKSIGIKGEARPDMKGVPKRPRMGELGDAGKEFVAWMLKYDMPQAIVRYGIYCDENGEPIKREVLRISENTVDGRNLRPRSSPEPQIGESHEKGPIFRERSEVETEGYIARRATALTFTPSEVLGGWVPDEDGYETMDDTEDSE